MAVVNVMRDMGFIWEKNTIGIKFDNGVWNVNAVLKNDDGSRKPVWGFLRFDTVEEAVDAANAMRF